MEQQATSLNEQNRHLFAPKLSLEQKTQQMHLMNMFRGLVGERYCLAYGTLLGAMLYEGFIPWDDDVDIFCLKDDKALIKAACEESGCLEWHDMARGPVRYSSKVWFKGSKHRSRAPWSWPFIDILWLEEMDEETLRDASNHKIYLKSDIDWSETRLLFEGQFHPVPRHAEQVIRVRHPHAFEYATPPAWDHLTEMPLRAFSELRVPLQELQEWYPALATTLPRYQKQAR